MKYDEEHEFNSHILLRQVYTQIHDINILHELKRIHSTFDKICLDGLAIPIREVSGKKGRWLAWIKPDQHRFKLNVDGSRKGHLGAGRGVIRNRRGEFICGFSAPYDFDDVIEAEMHALYDGMDM